ncbi:MAG TPA: biopolymer transporter ExbD [Polyangiaceae bacterium]|jgi:biopolymer transport protein ExbD|nr:MAG: colicin uptake protein TolR [Deltaproteobacteria bacterium ADurb.Bin207]HNS96719.1 biopolymer transporter ExbD [Polyangiaceae bacterium]HNZ22428.1 biopolymer transporter ExbD [Polyangiaceae bacterium]HOD20963.1 biopolymer transporter ExbD [Polyangiaceae bacterium]HOE48322.1 biopolymer transporter ExbD [Polyangiaceae bacterium]
MISGSTDDTDGITGINIVPLVDITLVLLIIMMVTAKIIVSQSVPMDLPKASSGQNVQMIFAVQLYKNGDVFVDQKKLPGDEAILGLAREARSKNEDLRAVIQAEQAVTHGRVIGVLELLKTAGISKIAFGVTPVDKVDESRKDGEGK